MVICLVTLKLSEQITTLSLVMFVCFWFVHTLRVAVTFTYSLFVALIIFNRLNISCYTVLLCFIFLHDF